MRIERYGKTRYWAVVDTTGSLVCVCVYQKGATEVVRRLQTLVLAQQGQETKEDISSNVVVSEKC